MAMSQLRLYRGPEEQRAIATTPDECTAKPCVTVSVGEVLPLLAEAVASQKLWVEDFADDEITISADLYETLMAYRYFRPVA